MKVLRLVPVTMWLVMGMPTLGLAAYGSSMVNCEDNLKAQGIDDRSEIQRRCAVCLNDPNNNICFEGGTKNESGYGSSSSSRRSSGGNSGGGSRDSSASGQMIQDYDRCLEQRVKGPNHGTANVMYINRCHGQDIQVQNVCGSLGMRPVADDDSLLVFGGSSSDKVCFERR